MAAVASSSPPAAILGPQPTLVPYEPTRDCSQGLCSMYCPQWCYFVFPPPPPAFDLGGPDTDDSSGPTFSPLVIAIIGVLASAFLLVSYYTIISKYCGTFTSLWNMVFGSHRRHGHGHGRGGGGGGGGSRSQDPWSAAPSDGLDETLINKITVCKYKRGDGFVDSTDCSVCLGEFRDGESLRLLPKCSHAFHLPCIDTWLKSHSNCPLCRCNIAFVTVGVVSPEPERRRGPPEDDRRDRPPEVVLTIDDYSEQARDDEPQNQNAAGTRSEEAAKDCPGRSEEGSGIGEIKEDGGAPAVRASSSLPHVHRRRAAGQPGGRADDGQGEWPPGRLVGVVKTPWGAKQQGRRRRAQRARIAGSEEIADGGKVMLQQQEWWQGKGFSSSDDVGAVDVDPQPFIGGWCVCAQRAAHGVWGRKQRRDRAFVLDLTRGVHTVVADWWYFIFCGVEVELSFGSDLRTATHLAQKNSHKRIGPRPQWDPAVYMIGEYHVHQTLLLSSIAGDAVGRSARGRGGLILQHALGGEHLLLLLLGGLGVDDAEHVVDCGGDVVHRRQAASFLHLQNTARFG
nr:unnamed protein product [Digitaria exilis]